MTIMTTMPCKHDSFKIYTPLLLALVLLGFSCSDNTPQTAVAIDEPKIDVPPLDPNEPLPAEYFVVNETTVTEFKKNRRWFTMGAAHGKDPDGTEWTSLSFSDGDDKSQVQYNFRKNVYVGPENNWDWPPEEEFTFEWHSRRS